MRHTLKNNRLTIEVESLGGELMSLQTPDGAQYLWQGDPAYWANRATNLFPFVGRLLETRYTYEGKSYEMPLHGFVRQSQMECTEETEDTLVFTLRDRDETRKIYPFAFEYQVAYTLVENRLEMQYRVYNPGDKHLYFGMGGHPGFYVPLEEGLAFEDYYMEFAQPHTPNLQIFTDACLATGNKEPYPLVDEKKLPLRHHLFDHDALILSEVCRSVTLKSEKGSRAVQVDFPDMPYLGLWHRSETEAPYVCIEPWVSLPGRGDEITAFEKKEDLICLAPGGRYINRWSIAVV